MDNVKKIAEKTNEETVGPITAENLIKNGMHMYDAQKEEAARLERLSKKAVCLARVLKATSSNMNDSEFVNANLEIYNRYNSEKFFNDISDDDLRMLELLSYQASWPIWKRNIGSYNFEQSGEKVEIGSIESTTGYPSYSGRDLTKKYIQ